MLELNRTMDGWGAARRRSVVAVYVIVTVALAVWAALALGRIFDQPDASIYLNLAAGNKVMMPFAGRQLGPLLVRGLMAVTGLGLQPAFLVEGLVALILFVGCAGFLLVRSGAPRWMLVALGGMLFWGVQLNGLAMPDLVYAALLCGLLLLVRKEKMMAAALMMFPMMLSRESALLTLGCFLWAGWRRLRGREVAAAIGAAVAGMAVVARLTAGALPNKEHLPAMLYLVGKMPWNLVKNVLGIGVWANLYPTCAVPQWQTPLHVGPLDAVGYCGMVPWWPVETFAYALASFGLLPLLLIRLRRVGVGREDVLLRFALLYGGISFVAAPLLGESFARLYGFGWPLFLVALPLLVGAGRGHFVSGWAVAGFVALHLGLSWTMFGQFGRHTRQGLVVAVILHGVGWLLLRVAFRVGAVEAQA